jgi:hypothetical protein
VVVCLVFVVFIFGDGDDKVIFKLYSNAIV